MVIPRAVGRSDPGEAVSPIRPLPSLSRVELLALGDRPVGRRLADRDWARSLPEEDLRDAVAGGYDSLMERGLLRVVGESDGKPQLSATRECAIVVGMRACPDTVTILGEDGVADPLMIVSHCRLRDGVNWCLVELCVQEGISQFTLCAPEIAAGVMVHCLTDRLGDTTRRLEMVDSELLTVLEANVAAGPDSSVVVQERSGTSMDMVEFNREILQRWRVVDPVARS